MFASAGDGRSGHERAHDPCRADWKEVTADPTEPAVSWLLPSCAVAFLVVIVIWVLSTL